MDLKVLKILPTECDLEKQTAKQPKISPLMDLNSKGHLHVHSNWPFRDGTGFRQAARRAVTASFGLIPDAIVCAGFFLRLQARGPASPVHTVCHHRGGTLVAPSLYFSRFSPHERMKAFLVALMKNRFILMKLAKVTHPSHLWPIAWRYDDLIG